MSTKPKTTRRAGARVRPLHLPKEASEETYAELRVFLGE